MNSSLRRQLLAWVLLPLMSAVAIDTWLGYQRAADTATVVQDRLLLGSARMIAEQISFEDGSFQHQIPPAALELFQSQESDRIYYRLTTGTGQLLAGYTALPVPDARLAAAAPYFFTAMMRGEPLRVVAFLQPVVGNPSALPVLVEVAQTTYAHKQLINRLWLHALEQQLLILALVALFILFGLHRGLRPLIRLRDDVRARQEGSLQPLKTNNLPFEIRPLVESFNDYIRRLENYTVSRAHLVQNATHQLRTPLAVLNTQVSDALRASSQQEAQTPLLAARKTLQQTAHLVNQFLALTSAEAHVADKTPLTSQQCCDIVQEVLEDLAALAHKKAIDLGFERSGSDVLVVTDAAALREIAVNVIDNAIRYTPPQGMVTVRVQSGAGKLCLIIEDNGPGVPLDSQEKIFDRFYRLDRTDSHGSGLGLAIVKELASQCGAEVRVIKPSHGGAGFALEVEFKNAKKGYQENLAPL